MTSEVTVPKTDFVKSVTSDPAVPNNTSNLPIVKIEKEDVSGDKYEEGTTIKSIDPIDIDLDIIDDIELDYLSSKSTEVSPKKPGKNKRTIDLVDKCRQKLRHKQKGKKAKKARKSINFSQNA